MPQGPYSGLGYTLSAIGANAPAGYMRGKQFAQQQQAGEAALESERLKNQAAQISMEHGQQEYQGMQQSAQEATDDQGNLDIDRFYKGLAQKAPNTFMQHMNSYGGMVYHQGQLGVQQGKLQQSARASLQAALPTIANALANEPDPDKRNAMLEAYGPMAQTAGIDMTPYQKMGQEDWGKLAKGAPGMAKTEAQISGREETAKIGAEARIAAARIAASSRLQAVRIGFSERPLSNPEAQFYKDMKDNGLSPEDAMGALSEVRINLAEAKKKSLDPNAAVAQAVIQAEKTHISLTGKPFKVEDKDSLETYYHRLYNEVQTPKTSAAPAAKSPKGTPAPVGYKDPASGLTKQADGTWK